MYSEPITLWHRYHSTHDNRVRDQLVSACVPYVKKAACRVGVRMAPHTRDHGELMSYGFDGLLAGIDNFDPHTAVEFGSWITKQAEWAIRSAQRDYDWTPRSVRLRSFELETAIAALGARLRRTPTEAETIAELGWSAAKYADHIGDLTRSSVCSLDAKRREDRTQTLLDVVENQNTSSPEGSLDAIDKRDRLDAALKLMPQTERMVVELYYRKELTQTEVGIILGVSCSRVSQICTRAVRDLAAQLNN